MTWWLHVSATDCEHKGGYGKCDNCKLEHSDWEASPNFKLGLPVSDVVEIKTFGKLGIDPITNSTIGISMMVTNTFSVWRSCPVDADYSNPSGRGIVVFDKSIE